MARIVNDDDQQVAHQRLLRKYKVAKPSAQDVRTSRAEVVAFAEWEDDLFTNPLLYKDPFD
jgi:hypothetical protein